MQQGRIKILFAAILTILTVTTGVFILRTSILRTARFPDRKPLTAAKLMTPAPLPVDVIPLTTFATLPIERRGIDCSEDARGGNLACLGSKVAYIGRYYSSTNPAKTLSRPEGLAISKQGMRILVFFQNGARSRRSFGAALGERNGEAAWNEAHAVGQPPNTAIYFCVDYPAPEADIYGYILPYFESVTRGMENARMAWGHRHKTQPAGNYSAGIYAGPPVIQAILADPKRTLPPHPFIWLAMPPIWQTPREPVEYIQYLKARHWTSWQIRVAEICHRAGHPNIGFPCDEDEIGTAANGSFVLRQ